MLHTAVEYGGGPVAVRYPRDYGYGVPENGALREIEIGKGEVLRKGQDVGIIAIGSMVMPALGAAGLLEDKGIEAAVVNARFLKPLDADLIRATAKSVDLVVTVEENSVKGGFGSAVAQCLIEAGIKTPLKIIGIPDEFVEHAPRGELLKNLGLSADGIAAEVAGVIGHPPKKAEGARAPSGRET